MRRIEAARTEVMVLMKSTWWNRAPRPEQSGPAFNALVRCKYREDLTLVDMDETVMSEDESRMEVATKALLRKKTNMHDASRKKLTTLLQWEYLKGMVEKEVRGTVIRWIEWTQGFGKEAAMARLALQQASHLGGNPLLNGLLLK